MTSHPTGHLIAADERMALTFDREFDAPITDVWTSMTDRIRLEEWIGHWTGSPTTDTVTFITAAETEVMTEHIRIIDCDEPHRFVAIHGHGETERWIWFNLSDATIGVTRLTFGHTLLALEEATSIGPGWDFYLDRLVASRRGTLLPSWEDYYPAYVPHYESLIESNAYR